jgi:hypothetical protein
VPDNQEVHPIVCSLRPCGPNPPSGEMEAVNGRSCVPWAPWQGSGLSPVKGFRFARHIPRKVGTDLLPGLGTEALSGGWRLAGLKACQV